MDLSIAQWIGLSAVALLIVGALAFMVYEDGRLAYLFRPAFRTIIIWAIVLLILQTIFILGADVASK